MPLFLGTGSCRIVSTFWWLVVGCTRLILFPFICVFTGILIKKNCVMEVIILGYCIRFPFSVFIL